MKFILPFRVRLLVSHILPVLLLVPLVGFALIYLLETRLIIPTLANELIDQGMLVKRLTYDRPEVWNLTSEAQVLVNSIDFRRPTRIGLLAPDHRLLATSRPDDLDLVGTVIANLPDSKTLDDAWWAITPGDRPKEQILDVVIPVQGTDGQITGLVRVYRRITDIEQSFASMRLLVFGVLLAGVLITGTISVLLAESFNRSLKEFSHAIAESPLQGPPHHLPEANESEFVEISRAYNRLQDRRLELEETRQLMLANMIHEIGRPLGSLRTAVHALQVGAMNDLPLRTDLLKGMSERIDRLGRLLEDLALTYRSLEPQEINVQSIQINEWLEPLTSLWAESAQQKQQLWEVILDDDLPVIQTDPDRLAQALGNLVNNAIKFTPAGGKITIICRYEDMKINIQVRDTGIGISPEGQLHLFVPFYRITEPSWKSPGLGLGLSIASSIIDSLGGEITVASVPGEGSTFTIILPI